MVGADPECSDSGQCRGSMAASLPRYLLSAFTISSSSSSFDRLPSVHRSLSLIKAYFVSAMFRQRQPKCHLLALPAEIREAIFTFAVISPKPVVTFKLDNYQQESYQEAIQPAVTRVNRQVRQEALPLFYDSNEFILHTEGQKGEDAHHWIYNIQHHLLKLQNIAFWLRYVTLTNDHATHSGALGVAMYYQPKQHTWEVNDEWRWITVVKKPAGIDGDGKLLVTSLRQLVKEQSDSSLHADRLVGLMTDLRMLYIKDKMG